MDSDDDRVEVGQLNRHIPEPDGKEEQKQHKYNHCRLSALRTSIVHVVACLKTDIATDSLPPPYSYYYLSSYFFRLLKLGPPP